jgi:hypothetical protein
MIIKDLNGKGREVRVDYFKGTALVTSDAHTLEPLASVIIHDTGEMCAAMRAPEFRDNKELTEMGIDVIRKAVLQGVIPVTSGYLYSFLDPEHGTNKLMPLMGAELTEVEVDGKKLNRWAIPLNRVLSGALK